MTRFYRFTLSFLLLATLLPAALSAQESATIEREGESNAPLNRELYYYGIRSYPFGKIPQFARQKALEQARTMTLRNEKRSRSLSDDQWHPIGPNAIGGRVNSIALHPTDPQTLWIGAADGGVWKSTDAGSSWTPIMDFENAMAMGAVAVDPNDPDVLYAGTGEQTANVDAYLGAGIFKTTDGGANWRVAGLTQVGGFSRIVVRADNGNIVYAGGAKNDGGFYRSDDGGQTWQKATGMAAVADFTVNPQNPDEVWAAGFTSGIFHSTDGGRSFTPSSNGFDDTWSDARSAVQVAPSDPSRLYALVDETLGASAERTTVYRSNDGGASWTSVYTGSGGQNVLNGQGWYNNVIAVKPDDPDVVVCGGVWMIRSSDGGDNWSQVGANVHPDHHAFAFDPANPERFFDGNDGGMYRSTNGGMTFGEINSGLAITQFYDVGVDQEAADVSYGGTQDNGTLSSSGVQIAGGDGGMIVVSPFDHNLVIGEFQQGELWKLDRSSGIVNRDISTGIDLSDNVAWVAPLAIDQENQFVYYGRQYVWGNYDFGQGSWVKLSPKFTSTILAIAVSPADHGQTIWAGASDGELMMSTDGGDTWVDRTGAPDLPNRAVTDFAPSSTDPATCYVTFGGFLSGHVFRTTDAGATWTDLSETLPDIPTTAIALHPDDENIIYVGTDIGVFITLDGGATWSEYSNGLPRVGVADLEVHESSKTLRLASHGRSMWEIDLVSPSIAPSITAPTGGEVWTGSSAHVIGWNGFSGPVRVEYSVDDGSTWTTLGENVAGNAFRWIVPNTQSEHARVRVSAQGGEESVVSRSFTIAQVRIGSFVAHASKSVVPYGITYDGDNVWVDDFYSNRLLKLDPKTLETVATVHMSLQGGDSLFTGMTYMPDHGTLFIHKLNSTTGTTGGVLYEVTRDGEQVGKWPSPCTYPIGVTWMGGDNSELPFLLVGDRDAHQELYLLDASNPGIPLVTYQRKRQVELGPRGIASAHDGTNFFQIETDFTGGTLQSAHARLLSADDEQNESCSFELSSPGESSDINARGVEYDPADKNIWVTDFTGDIWKMVTCEGINSIPTSAVPAESTALDLALQQNVPNPFTNATSIEFTLTSAAQARLVVYDMSGRTVATLLDGRLDAGRHTVRFDPWSVAGGIASGVYRYTLVLDGHASASRSMVFVR